ncbi:MAG: methyl-accepting chemotaxis protein, partial [Clostridia bacterium]|nr:methyl-accepting chemotaxis protein [Clostridia bacterium]
MLQRDEMGQLAHAVAEMDAKMCELLKELTGLIVQTDATSRELSAVVEKISVQGQKIANSAEQIASGKKETLVSAEEISAARIDLKNGTKKLEHKDGDRPVKIGETET